MYGLSNARLDSPWKKVTRGKSRFSECVSRLQSGIVDRPECERQLLDLLSDQTWCAGLLSLTCTMQVNDGSTKFMCTKGYRHPTMEPPNKGHFGANSFVPCREVAPISEVK